MVDPYGGEQVEAPLSGRPAREFVPHGLGWQAVSRPEKVRVTFTELRRGTSGLSAQIKVECAQPGLGGGTLLTVERLALGSGRDRASLANRLTDRVALPDSDWRTLIDSMCSEVLSRESTGEPFSVLGAAPRRREKDWLIEGLLYRRSATQLYADGESGKSWIAMALCVSLSAGVEVVPGFRPIAVGKPLYLDWETDEETQNDRVWQICRAIGIDPPHIAYRLCTLPFVDQLDQVMRKCQDEEIDLVVLDSVEAALSGSRSDGADANEAASKLNQALRRLRRASLLIDHVSAEGAGSKVVPGKAYGSIFKRNWVREAVFLRKVKERTPDGLGHLALYWTKANNRGRPDPMGLSWEVNDEICSWQREQIEDPELATGLPKVDQVALALREKPYSVSDLVEETGIARGTVSAILKRGAERFRRRADGLWELLPPAAREAPGSRMPYAERDEGEELPLI